MTSVNLTNLEKVGQLKKEPFDRSEYDGLLKSGQAKFEDAHLDGMSKESCFDLTYNAAHSLALAALRFHGYRSNNRYIVFQALLHTVGVGPEIWRVLAKCHDHRNVAEYEGFFDVDDQLLIELKNATRSLLEKVPALVR